jgi:ATP-dependent Lon protease
MLAGMEAQETLPLVPLRDNVVFPGQVAPLAAGRPRSVSALEEAARGDGRVVLAVQRDPELNDIGLGDLCPIGVLAHVGALRRLGGGGAQALVEGRSRVRLVSLDKAGDSWRAGIAAVEEHPVAAEPEVDALVTTVKGLFAQGAGAAGTSPDVNVTMSRAAEPGQVADIAAAAPDLVLSERVRLLEETDPVRRLRELVPLLARQVEVAQLRARIAEDVQRTITRAQREHILREQLRVVRRELAELDGADDDGADLLTRIDSLPMPDEPKQRVRKEVSRLEQIPSASPEMSVVRTWIDLIFDLPWGAPAAEQIDIAQTARILDEDHDGLAKVKDRLLEWLAVRQRIEDHQAARDAADATAAVAAGDSVAGEPVEDAIAGDATAEPEPVGPAVASPEAASARSRRVLQTPILCLVGPPGVGKTSLGRSIARALGRKFVRLSLGGLRDEAEIRGHRRTYIGAMPGRIIQAMRQAGAANPVIMLDEIDKIGMDFRGDPAAALLEVLDPEQNFQFSDHYLEIPYDLSHVLFITTANLSDPISPALRDRMEIIRMTGYTEREKLGIAIRHLIPKQLEQHALDQGELTITDAALGAILHGYTREAGVRQFDRAIAEIARKLPRKLAEGSAERLEVGPGDLADLLGPQRFDYGETPDEDQVGAVTGVVVSDAGGDVITVEALAIPGRSDLVLTGQLGNVMEESARAALSWARVHSEEYGAAADFFDGNGLHIHVPAGAIPKDGPSAGVTMTTAMVSVATQRKVRRDVAMTGEVTLRGRVLPVGGVKDKLLAAHRAGIATFILPSKNRRDLHDIDAEVLQHVQVITVDNLTEVLEHALLPADPDHARRQVGFLFPYPPAGSPSIPTA